MEICVFRQIPPYGSSASTHDGTKYYSRTAKCKNNNVEVQTIKWYKSFFALPSTHNSEHNCVKNLLKYPSPVTARNPDEQKFVPPSSSTKMWSAYVSLHKVFPFHLKIRCTVEFSLAMCVIACVQTITKL